MKSSLPAQSISRQQWLPDLVFGFENLVDHKLRSLLTMLGMIFGVAAVVAMLSIGAGAQQKVMAFIEQLGVKNLIVEAKEVNNWRDLRNIRKTSPGLTLSDYQVIRKSITEIRDGTPRKRFAPSKLLPKPQQDMPVVYGVEPSYLSISALHVTEGRFFTASENAASAPVCVLGLAAKEGIFGAAPAVGEYVKLNEQWFHVIGVIGPQLESHADVSGVRAEDTNNLVYAPLNSVLYRLEDVQSGMKDEVDGLYLQLSSADDSASTAKVVRGILNSSHHNAGDFNVIVPAELLAQQKRTEKLFNTVMVAIASISLLVGGIGIMNIMLAAILERTREIGVRRAVGARRGDIIRQFVIEAVLISFAGGLIGVILGFAMSQLIAWLAGWSTVVTFGSIILAFCVSISVGLIFGIYPAVKAARLDPVEAIRYE
ncbi:MAG TPA: ABC transporter permease [Candidatus Saccharimonadales bacterium]|nr:ABC transporter permease [Candidatus Saccharimonadales bacterium]